jgi:hypothetical protein
MKTKEIDVWGYKNTLNRVFEDNIMCDLFTEQEIKKFGNLKLEEMYRAKLIIEIPEKKIEITESEFDEACLSAGEYEDYDRRYVYIDKLKKELGF